MKVFVYGTLKSNHGANRLLGNSKKIGNGTTVSDSFTMYDGGFPCVVKGGLHHIKGELYEVEDNNVLVRLDQYEGAPTLFHRSDVEVKTEDNELHEAFMYIYSSNRVGGRKVVPNDNNECIW